MPFDVMDDGSSEPLNNSGIVHHNHRMKKISYGKSDIIISVIFGVLFYLFDAIGDVIGVYTISQYSDVIDFEIASLQYYGNYSSCFASNATQRHITHDGSTSSNSIDNPYFWFSISVLVVTSIYISFKSGRSYWMKERENKLTFKSFQDRQHSLCVVLRWLSHILLVAPIARTIDLIYLRKNCWQSLVSENNLHEDTAAIDIDEKKQTGNQLFDEQVKEREQELTNLLHQENSFKSGPQLWLKIHLLFLFLFSENNELGICGYLNIVFIFVGIASCAWKTVCNRKTNNLSNDNEKKFSCGKHIIPLLFGHCLSVGARFILLGMLSATSFSWLRTFCETHFGLIFFVIAVYKTEDGTSFYIPSPNRGSVWNKVADIFNVLDIQFSTFFSFLDFDEDKDKALRIIVYYGIPYIENLILFAILTPTMNRALRITIIIAMIVSAILFAACENFHGLGILSPSPPSSSANDSDEYKRDDGNSDSTSSHLQPSSNYSSTETDIQDISNGELSNSTRSRSTNAVRPYDGRGRPPETAVGIAWWQRWTMTGLLDKFQRKRKEKEESSDSEEKDDQDVARERIKCSGIEASKCEEDERTESVESPSPETVVRRRLVGSSKPKVMGDNSDNPTRQSPKMRKKKRKDNDEDSDDPSEKRRSDRGVIESLKVLEAQSNEEQDGMSIDSNVGDRIDIPDDSVLISRHIPPQKEWKDVNDLLRDGDLNDLEKDAIHRNDLNWICQYMKNNLFQVLTLMLAEKGTDVNARNVLKDTPILNLCKFYFEEDLLEILELLVNKGAEVEAVDSVGRTMLHRVCDKYSQHRNQKTIIDLLIKKGVPVNAKDCFGDTALHLLAKNFTEENITDTVDLLIKAGFSVDTKNKDGETVLDLLTRYYKYENMKDIVKLFIKAKDSVDAKNQPGVTASKPEVMGDDSDSPTGQSTKNKKKKRKEEWKDMNDLLSDGDLNDREKDAIRRNDLNWICQHMMNNLFQVLTLMLAEKGTDVNARGEYKRTPALQLCEYYDKEDFGKILELLIKKGAEVKAVDYFDKTMLHLVCKNYSQRRNLKDIIDLLIKRGVPVDARDFRGNTVLHSIAEDPFKQRMFYFDTGNLESSYYKDIVDLLIKGGVKVDTKNEDGYTALHLIAKFYKGGHMKDIVELFIKAGFPVDAKNKLEKTVLHQLVKSYQHDNLEDTIDLFIKAGATVDAQDKDRRTVLHYLAENYMHKNKKSIFDLLIKAGVPVDAIDREGNTALHLIAKYYDNDHKKDIVELFIDAGCPVYAKNEDGDTVLHLIAKNYDGDHMKDIVELFIKAGFPVDAKNKLEQTVLHQLVKSYQHDNLEDIIELFMKAGATVDAQDKDRRTVLHCLAVNYKHKNKKSIFDLLIKGGVPVEAKDKWGDTALHDLALIHKHDDLEEIVRFLIDKGSRLDVQNNSGCTPLIELCRNENKLKHIRVFSLLTPDACDDPILSDTQSVIRLIEEFDKKKIGAKDLEDGLGKIYSDVTIKYKQQK